MLMNGMARKTGFFLRSPKYRLRPVMSRRPMKIVIITISLLFF